MSCPRKAGGIVQGLLSLEWVSRISESSPANDRHRGSTRLPLTTNQLKQVSIHSMNVCPMGPTQRQPTEQGEQAPRDAWLTGSCEVLDLLSHQK